MQKLAPGGLGILPHFIIQQTLLEADVRGPRNAQLMFFELTRQFSEEGRRIGFIGKMKMMRMILVTEESNFLDDLLDLLGPISSRIPFSMIAKFTAPPVATSGCEIGKHGFRHEVSF